MELTSSNVEALLRECLTVDLYEPVQGILHGYIFDPAKIEQVKPSIAAMLYQLPDPFMKTKGGGWSFLHMCERRDGVLWTGMHLVMEQLICLGEAAGLVSYPLPRELWSSLPGGVPYVVVDDEAIEAVYKGEPA